MDRQIDRQTDRQIDRQQTDRQTDKQTDRQTHTHRRPHRNNFKKPGMCQPVVSASGLKNPDLTFVVVHLAISIIMITIILPHILIIMLQPANYCFSFFSIFEFLFHVYIRITLIQDLRKAMSYNQQWLLISCDYTSPVKAVYLFKYWPYMYSILAIMCMCMEILN